MRDLNTEKLRCYLRLLGGFFGVSVFKLKRELIFSEGYALKYPNQQVVETPATSGLRGLLDFWTVRLLDC
ncbi:MAG: hypothetical protein LBC98_00300 [Prevotellaceae bacterium]|jgi:hypothetical protein|nr:hypothetical protein [Prevotellaceae bacterium]